MRLLLVEDEPALVEWMKEDLEAAGYVVDTADDGVEGQRKALAGNYDILVVDWNLPRQDGRALVKNVHRVHADVPVLMLTAIADETDAVSGADSGADAYLLKPFLCDELLAQVHRLCERYAPAMN